ncbi:MAG: FapA family protein [Treponema sp.]|jgi:uncharacterized protein (DUF342 family)|nr:FapA family protein [Treponema sp.]
MVDFVGLQRIVKEQLERDRSVHSVEATGDTLDQAVAAAATLLSVPVRRLEYEVTERGFGGFMGAGRKDWKIRAYERAQADRRAKKDAEEKKDTEETETPVIVDWNGEIFVRLFLEGAFLKVTPPHGKGAGVSEDAVIEALLQRGVQEFDRALVSKTVKEAAGEYIHVGDFQRNSANDSTLTIDIVEGEMKANVTVSRPGPGGRDYSPENYVNFLHSNKVYYGIRDDAIAKQVDRPVYGEPVSLAEGDRALDGRDAYIQYNFETDQNKVRLREGANGRINFKDLNIIQNVVENQPLAVKIAAEKGKNGKNIRGLLLLAKDGKDIPLPLGKNVHVGDDGVSIIADINGQVLLVNNKINVEPVYTVDGGVNLKSGNIEFLGTVIINGDVEDGFLVKAAGNIEVNGTVEKARLESEGNIIVTQGITGKGEGVIRAGHSVWAKFIENALVEAGDLVVVSDGIINSRVDAANRVLCQGKRAAIVGGQVRACEEINAKTLGSPVSGTETLFEAGYDPGLKTRMARLAETKEKVRREFDELQRNIQTLINIKRQRKALPEDKEIALADFMAQRQTLIGIIKKTEEDLSQVQTALSATTTRGRVSASAKVYPGVRITIRDIREDVRTEFKAVTFVLEDALIKATPYEETDQELMKAPDGYTAN